MKSLFSTLRTLYKYCLTFSGNDNNGCEVVILYPTIRDCSGKMKNHTHGLHFGRNSDSMCMHYLNAVYNFNGNSLTLFMSLFLFQEVYCVKNKRCKMVPNKKSQQELVGWLLFEARPHSVSADNHINLIFKFPSFQPFLVHR